MQEIKDILAKHDIAGIIAIHTPGYNEFISKLDPSYSCCKFEGGDVIRVTAKLDDFGGNAALRNQAIADTSNMLNGLCMVTAGMLMPLMGLSEKLDEIIGADHSEGGFTSHTTQNN